MKHENEQLNNSNYDNWRLENNEECDAEESMHPLKDYLIKKDSEEKNSRPFSTDALLADLKKIIDDDLRIKNIVLKIQTVKSYEIFDLLDEYYKLRKEFDANH